MIIYKKYTIGITFRIEVGYYVHNTTERIQKDTLYYISDMHQLFIFTKEPIEIELKDIILIDLERYNKRLNNIGIYPDQMELKILTVYIGVKEITTIGTYRFITTNDPRMFFSSNLVVDETTIPEINKRFIRLLSTEGLTEYIVTCCTCNIDITKTTAHYLKYPGYCPTCLGDKGYESYKSILDAQIAYKLLTT
ncbi:MAG: hypothetical protein WCX82_03475 [archaeon]|jgi:hypothetical protein